jgi:fatty acid desaturase
MSRHSSGNPPADRPPVPPPSGKPPRRKRVVLNDSRNPVTVVRVITELEEQTSVGEALVRNLVRAQLRMALGLAALIAVLFGGLPLAFYLSPAFATATVFGVRLPWLLLGVLPFPVLFAIGLVYNRLAERHEKDFVNMVES